MSETRIDPHLVRESAIAGTWYPGRRDDLDALVARYLAEAPISVMNGDLVGLIAPHAGYMYSGAVAAHAYKLLENRRYDLVAVISPSHRYYSGSLLVSRGSYYRTPLGLVEVAHDLMREIGSQVRLDGVDRDDEHSLEIQLPFLQHQLGAFRLVPIMMEDQSIGLASRLGQVLAAVLAGKNALLVASTDLSHFHTYDRAVALDRRSLADMERFDPEVLDRDISAGLAEACGYGAVLAVLVAARAAGANKVSILKYANSGDVTGDRNRVVGYGAAAISREARQVANQNLPV
jgi:AmmeMemoRadiSam system protein B